MSAHSSSTPARTRPRRVRRTAGLLLAFTAVTGVAYAFWTIQGTGDGTADTAQLQGLVVNQTSSVAGLAPGVAPKPLEGTFDNPNAASVFVSEVTAVVTGTDAQGCDASNYEITGSAPVGEEIGSGPDQGAWGGLRIAFVNKPDVNQNACQGALVHVAYTSH